MKKVSLVFLLIVVANTNAYLHSPESYPYVKDESKKIGLIKKTDPELLNTSTFQEEQKSYSETLSQEERSEFGDDTTLSVVVRDTGTGAETSLKIKTHDFVEFLRKKSLSSKTFMVRLFSWVKDQSKPAGFLVKKVTHYTVSVLFAAWIIGNFFHFLTVYHIPYKALDILVSGTVEVFVDGCSGMLRSPEACVRLARMLFGPGGPLNDDGCTTNPLLISEKYPLCPGIEMPVDLSWMGYGIDYLSSWGIGSR
jgi:hypothetical protein